MCLISLYPKTFLSNNLCCVLIIWCFKLRPKWLKCCKYDHLLLFLCLGAATEYRRAPYGCKTPAWGLHDALHHTVSVMNSLRQLIYNHFSYPASPWHSVWLLWWISATVTGLWNLTYSHAEMETVLLALLALYMLLGLDQRLQKDERVAFIFQKDIGGDI